MDYPNFELLALLQRTATVPQYRAAIQPWAKWALKHPLYDDRFMSYWPLIPSYRYTCCPFCHKTYQEPIDTYTLLLWVPILDMTSRAFVTSQHPLPAPCEHFIGVQRFINLHGRLPHEMVYFSNPTGELPYLTPWFFADDIRSFAVLHALPICRIEAEKFLPSYTVCFLTYFSENKNEIRRRHKVESNEFGKNDPDFYPADVFPPGEGLAYYDPYYDLPAWADRGALGWLDYREPTLPLRFGTGAELPSIYREMVGGRTPYTWREGKNALGMGRS